MCRKDGYFFSGSISQRGVGVAFFCWLPMNVSNRTGRLCDFLGEEKKDREGRRKIEKTYRKRQSRLIQNLRRGFDQSLKSPALFHPFEHAFRLSLSPSSSNFKHLFFLLLCKLASTKIPCIFDIDFSSHRTQINLKRV